LLVLTPQLVELEVIRDEFDRRGISLVQTSIGHLDCWDAPLLNLTLAIGGHGKAQFAIQTQYLLDRRPATEAVVCTGGAGALYGRLHVGDVVVGTATIEHDYRIRFVPSSLPQHVGYESLVETLVELVDKQRLGYNVWFGPIASGDEDIIDPVRASDLHRETGALCVAWEGSGGARAAKFNGVPFVEIRGITDTANSSAHGDYHRNLRIVMPRIATLLEHWRHRTLEL
jgi:adenosylhomocysteine nucleosidase